MLLQNSKCASRILDALRAFWMRFAHLTRLAEASLTGLASLGQRPRSARPDPSLQKGRGGVKTLLTNYRSLNKNSPSCELALEKRVHNPNTLDLWRSATQQVMYFFATLVFQAERLVPSFRLPFSQRDISAFIRTQVKLTISKGSSHSKSSQNHWKSIDNQVKLEFLA